jgi:hypothetical protein
MSRFKNTRQFLILEWLTQLRTYGTDMPARCSRQFGSHHVSCGLALQHPVVEECRRGHRCNTPCYEILNHHHLALNQASIMWLSQNLNRPETNSSQFKSNSWSKLRNSQIWNSKFLFRKLICYPSANRSFLSTFFNYWKFQSNSIEF